MFNEYSFLLNSSIPYSNVYKIKKNMEVSLEDITQEIFPNFQKIYPIVIDDLGYRYIVQDKLFVSFLKGNEQKVVQQLKKYNVSPHSEYKSFEKINVYIFKVQEKNIEDIYLTKKINSIRQSVQEIIWTYPVLSLELNGIHSLPNNKNDSGWHLDKIKAPNSWNNGFTGKNVNISIFSDGIDLVDNTALKNNIYINQSESFLDAGHDDDNNGFIDDVIGWDFVRNENIPFPKKFSHRFFDKNNPTLNDISGTCIAGIIAASPFENRPTGIAYNSKIFSIKVIESGRFTSEVELAKAINYVANFEDIHIQLHGWGLGVELPVTKKVIEKASQKQIIISPVGDSGSSSQVCFPATMAQVIAVAAVDPQGHVRYSNYNKWKNQVDIAAPGEGIATTDVHGPYGYGVYQTPQFIDTNYTNNYRGTNAATAIVTACIALMLEKDPSLSAEDIKTILKCTAKKTLNHSSSKLGPGILNIEAALQKIKK
ncbi:S8 family peptidase [Candidatus Uabimicrobium amorphum]|nr:S8 family serine peptidase [Candidatus Uabimicrobium amorphum]